MYSRVQIVIINQYRLFQDKILRRTALGRRVSSDCKPNISQVSTWRCRRACHSKHLRCNYTVPKYVKQQELRHYCIPVFSRHEFTVAFILCEFLSPCCACSNRRVASLTFCQIPRLLIKQTDGHFSSALICRLDVSFTGVESGAI